jgi:flagellar motor component MotA
MVQFSGFLVSLLLLTASLATPLKRTVAQIEADIASITTQVTVLHSAVQDFPASGVVGALVFVVKQLRHIGPISPAVL